jgi:DNA helicase-2/ATP-dependent DNA helicase PcrA
MNLKPYLSDLSECIILARTNRGLAPYESYCMGNGIPYRTLGKSGFWKRNEIQKAVEKLKLFGGLPTAVALSIAMPDIEARYRVADATERDNDALDNLIVFRDIAKKFPTVQEFVVYANKAIHRKNDRKGITLSTIHQAKGLEFRRVYLVGANAKMMPHPKGDPKEERRIWFVALSRAADNLRISFAGTPSPYLRRYLTDEILDKLREHAEEVNKLQAQHKLFA